MNTRSSTKKRGIGIAFDDAAPRNKKLNRKQLNFLDEEEILELCDRRLEECGFYLCGNIN